MVDGFSDGVPTGSCPRRRCEHNHLIFPKFIDVCLPGDVLTNSWSNWVLSPSIVDTSSNSLTAALLLSAVLLCKGVTMDSHY